MNGRYKIEKSSLDKNFCNKNICIEIDLRNGKS